MKFKYSKVSFFLRILLGVALLSPIFLLIRKVFPNIATEEFRFLILYVIIGLTVLVFFGSKNWFSKFIELKNNYIHFHSYQNGANVKNYDVNYDDIHSVSAKTVPLIGITSISIRTKNGDVFKITFSYCDFKEMVFKLIKILKNNRYEVEFSENLNTLF